MLKFSEAKHSGLIVFNSGLLLGVFINYDKQIIHFQQILLMLGSLAFFLSILSSFLSLFPSKGKIFFEKNKKKNINLYYFGDLAELNINSFLQQLKAVDEEFSPNNLDRDLMNQILINSRIVKDKFRQFKASLIITVLGLLLITITFVLGKIFSGWLIKSTLRNQFKNQKRER